MPSDKKNASSRQRGAANAKPPAHCKGAECFQDVPEVDICCCECADCQELNRQLLESQEKAYRNSTLH